MTGPQNARLANRPSDIHNGVCLMADFVTKCMKIALHGNFGFYVGRDCCLVDKDAHGLGKQIGFGNVEESAV